MSLLLCTSQTDGFSKSGQSGLASFSSLAKEGRFPEIVHILKSQRADQKEWLRAAITSHDESPLHILLQYQPPLHVVSLLIQKMSDGHSTAGSHRRKCDSNVPEAQVDSMGRTPLHIACAFACSVAVVARLLNGAATYFPKPAAVRDFADMIPLHWACQTASNLTEKGDIDNMIHVVGFLVEAYPNGVLKPNSLGLTACDLFTTNQSNATIAKILDQAWEKLQVQQDLEDEEEEKNYNCSKDKSWIPMEVAVSPYDCNDYDDDGSMVSDLGLRGASKRECRTNGLEWNSSAAPISSNDMGLVLEGSERSSSIASPRGMCVDTGFEVAIVTPPQNEKKRSKQLDDDFDELFSSLNGTAALDWYLEVEIVNKNTITRQGIAEKSHDMLSSDHGSFEPTDFIKSTKASPTPSGKASFGQASTSQTFLGSSGTLDFVDMFDTSVNPIDSTTVPSIARQGVTGGDEVWA